MSQQEYERKTNARARAVLLSQIEDTKDNVRLAYVLGARQKAGDTLNQQELDFLQEQEIEKRVLERLEKMADKVDVRASSKRHALLGEREVFTLLRFFYLVRIAQQGFLPLIANAYPTLEPQAIIYLADKLVAGSMGGISTIRHELSFYEIMRNETRNMAREIIFKLYHEAHEPVADGFKTTYKDIMHVAHCVAGQGIYDYQKNVGDFASAFVNPSLAPVPPIYVVLPHMSMAGADPKLTVPTVDPTLPIPGFLLSSQTAHVTPTAPKNVTEDTASSAWTDPTMLVDHINTVPLPPKTNGFVTPSSSSPLEAPTSEQVSVQTPVQTNGHVDGALDATHDDAADTVDNEADETTTADAEKTTKKKKSSSSSKKKSRKSKSDKAKRSESRASEDAATPATTTTTTTTTTTADHDEQFEDQEPENDNSNELQPQQQPQHQQEQDEEEEDNEEDRFADADLSDDEHEILRDNVNDEEETKDTTDTTQQQKAPSSTNATTTPTPPSDTTTVVPPSPSQWQNFAATCHSDTDGSHTPLSPKSSARSSPKIERRF